MRAEQTSFLFGANAPFIEELYARFLADPSSVDAEWQTFFGALAEQKGDVLAEVRGASWAPNGTRVIGAIDPDAVPPPPTATSRAARKPPPPRRRSRARPTPRSAPRRRIPRGR